MIRQQRRAELRDVEKSIKKAMKLKGYKEMEEYFNTLKKDDYELLQANTHPDPKAQAKFIHHTANMKYVISLEARREFLLSDVSKRTEPMPDQAVQVPPLLPGENADHSGVYKELSVQP